MARLRQQFLKPGFYGSPETGFRQLTADDLRLYRDDTNAAMSNAALPIPFLDVHCPKNSLDGPEADSFKTRGWLKEIIQNKDGSLSYLADITDPKAAKKIREKSIKFVSPELNPQFVKNGNHLGHIIRHMAFTPKPVSSDQGEMVLAMSEQAPTAPFVLSLETYQGAQMPDKDPSQMAEDEDKTEDVADDSPNADELDTNDTVAENEGEQKVDVSSIISQIAANSGAIIPDGTDLNSKAGLMIALAAILNANGAAEEVVDEVVEPIEEESPTVAQFSEPTENEKLLSAEIDKLKAVNAAQVHSRNTSALNLAIQGSKLSKGFKTDLSNYVNAVQFSEDGADQARLSISQVIKLVEKNVLPLQMSETATIEPETHQQEREGFFKEEGDDTPNQAEAAKLAKAGDARQFGHTHIGETRQVEHRQAPDLLQPAATPAKSGKGKTK